MAKKWFIRSFLPCGCMGLWEGRLCNSYGYVWAQRFCNSYGYVWVQGFLLCIMRDEKHPRRSECRVWAALASWLDFCRGFCNRWLKKWSQSCGVSNALALPWATPWLQPVV